MSSPVDRAAVESALNEFQDPESGRSVVKMGQVRTIAVTDGRIEIDLGLTTWSAPVWEETRKSVVAHLKRHFADVPRVDVRIVKHARPAEKIGEIGLPTKSVVAVGSGKGGVGKSTIAACLAYGLKNAGASIGLLDADVYGPSIPHLLGVSERPTTAGGRLQPIMKDGLRLMSMGFLVPPGEAVVWRGPMLHGAITQFLRDTNWGDLDYLIIDMPPGTGDIALTLSQLLPLTGAVVVCTPQDVALLDAVKAIAMFQKVSIPVLGIVENMSYFVCPGCNRQYDIFGSGGARHKAEELEVPFLGEVPINIGIRRRGDAGETGLNFDDPSVSQFLQPISQTLVRNLVSQRRDRPPLPSLAVL
jgi:ATP-binding protein involved in chromosome partitioning